MLSTTLCIQGGISGIGYCRSVISELPCFHNRNDPYNRPRRRTDHRG